MIRGTAKILFMFCFLAFSLIIGNFAAVAEAAPTVLLQLQVEEPYGSGIWQDTGVVRKAGEKAKYRLYYSISDTEGSTFEDLVAQVSFPSGQGVFTLVSERVLPLTVDTVESRIVGGSFVVDVNFKSPMSTGATGSLEFTMTSATGTTGADEQTLIPTLTLTGTTVKADSSREPLSVNAGIGPSWTTVKAPISWEVKKTVITSNPLYVADKDAYIVDYQIVVTKIPGAQNSRGESSIQLIDQLPDIPGLTPEVIFAKESYYGYRGVYNPVDKTITLNNPAPLSSSATVLVRVRYPKDQVDALGGTTLELTNKARIESILADGTPYVSPEASVTHTITPPPLIPIKAELKTFKSVRELTEISGTKLENSNLSYRYYTGFTLSGDEDVNYQPKQVEFIDEGLTFVKSDNTTYRPDLSEAIFTYVSLSSRYLQTIGGTWQFYYRTSDTGSWIKFGAVNTTAVTLPASATGWRWVVDNPDYAKFGSSVMFSTDVRINQRDETLPSLIQVDNKVTTVVTYPVTYPDVGVSTQEAINSLPVVNDQKIVTNWDKSATSAQHVKPAITGSTLAPGRQAEIVMGGALDESTSIVTKGVFRTALLPPEFSFNKMLTLLSPDQILTVTPNYEGTGLTLVRIDFNSDFPALKSASPGSTRFIVDISPTASLTTYQIPMCFGINSAQANDPSISHSRSSGSSATDIYDFDNDGDTTERLANYTAIFTLQATNAANVAKQTKGPYDEDWKDGASKVEIGDEFEYRIFFRNESSKTMTNLVLIDILPRPGDIDPLTNTSRNSTWQPILTTPVAPPSGGGTVYYSTSATPNMSPVVSNGWSGAWTTTAPSDLSTVKAIKIDFGDRQFAPESSVNTYLQMKVPDDTSLANRDIANNTIDYAVDEVLADGASTSPMLPAATGATSVIFRVPGSILGDFVWADLNGNGIQDDGEPGMNGLKVELHGYDIGTRSYTKQGETTTGFHPTTNLPGYYSFDGLREGKYYVQFPVGDGYTLTSKNVGSNRAIDSDAKANGATDIFDLADDTEKLDIDAGYVDIFPISGTLYYDLDGNGSYASGSDWPIPSYTVSLKDSTDTVVQTTTTDLTGKYAFTVAGAGSYTIEVDATTLQANGFKETQPIMNNTNIIASRAITLSNAAVTDQNFGFQSTNVVKAKVIWDINGNGSLTDPVDQPLEGIQVKLWDLTDSKYMGTAQITDATGAVSFSGVFLDRSYRVDIDTSDSATSTILASLTPNVNLFNDLSETPIDGQIVTGVLETSGLEAVFGYKSSQSILITASVILDVNGNNILTDPVDQGISPITVSLSSEGIVIATKNTDSSGKVTFTQADGLVAGSDYTIAVDSTSTLLENLTISSNVLNGNLLTSAPTSSVTVSDAANGNDVKFGYKNKGVVHGTVYEDIRQLGYYTIDDQPIARVRVDLVANSASLVHEGTAYNLGDLIKTIHTDADGNFTFDNLPVDVNYKIQITEYTGGPLKDKMLPSYDPTPIVPASTSYSTEAALSTASPIGGAYLFGFKSVFASGDIQIVKKAGVGSVRVGELVPYTITIINKKGIDIIEDIEIKDLIPAGFKYVDGSGRLKRKGTTTKIQPSGNRPITFTLTESSGVSRLDQGEEVTLSYFLVVGSGIQPGEYTNLATGHNSRGEQNSNSSSATVQVVSDPLFEDSLVFGKVFVDRNGDGQQNADEPGQGGVKLVTVRGEIITTDKQGRYHIPAISGGRSDRGSNFTLKLDVRSLPKGTKVLTDNPRTVRLTPGVPARVNFMILLPESEEK